MERAAGTYPDVALSVLTLAARTPISAFWIYQDTPDEPGAPIPLIGMVLVNPPLNQEKDSLLLAMVPLKKVMAENGRTKEKPVFPFGRDGLQGRAG